MNPYRVKSLERRLYGVCVGLVEDNEDPGKQARIKVRFPWLDDRTRSDWCRVAQPYAGNGYGVVLIPERGDEVLIAFMHGDMAEPVVIGGLYNGSDLPPTHKQRTARDQKLWRTKAGHEILLDDSASTRMIRLTTVGNRKLTLDDQNQAIVAESATGLKITIDDGAGTIKLEAGASTISLDRTGAIKVEGTTITVSGQQIQIG